MSEEETMSAEKRPTALFVYYSFSRQTRKVVVAMADTLTRRGWDVTQAEIEFTDPRYADRFSRIPMRHPTPTLVGMLPAQLRRTTGEIRIPPEAREGDYDLVVVGSPTWWLTTNIPIRSYLKSSAARAILAGKPFAAASVSRRYYRGNLKDIKRLGEGNGGAWIGQTHFVVAGGQVKSMLSWLGFMKHGEPQERVFGLRMPPPNLKPDYEEQARSFIGGVAARALHKPAGVAA